MLRLYLKVIEGIAFILVGILMIPTQIVKYIPQQWYITLPYEYLNHDFKIIGFIFVIIGILKLLQIRGDINAITTSNRL